MKPDQLLKLLLTLFVSTAEALIPTMGSQALGIVERAALVPERDVERVTKGMSAPDVDLAKRMARRLADVVSDFVVFVASRGRIRPDDEDEYQA